MSKIACKETFVAIIMCTQEYKLEEVHTVMQAVREAQKNQLPLALVPPVSSEGQHGKR
jgi:hypothetical protein